MSKIPRCQKFDSPFPVKKDPKYLFLCLREVVLAFFYVILLDFIPKIKFE